MNHKRLLNPLFLAILILLYTPAPAQSTAGPQLTQAIGAYTGSLAAAWRLYTGPLYLGFDHHAAGHPFFLSDSLLNASVEYDGIFYPSLNLSYDLVKDLVGGEGLQELR